MVKSILLVDDNDYTRSFLSRIFERKGISVYSTASGKEAVDLFQQYRPERVFLDIHLKDIDGITVFRKIRNIDVMASIYFITGDSNFAATAKELGADGFIMKPVNINDILDLIGT
jgi:DNA-binding response OmpR family regulator